MRLLRLQPTSIHSAMPKRGQILRAAIGLGQRRVKALHSVNLACATAVAMVLRRMRTRRFDGSRSLRRMETRLQ